MKVTFVYHRFPHHAKHSGYDILVKYLENTPFVSNRVVERLKGIDIAHFSDLRQFPRHLTKRYYFPIEFGLGVECSNIDETPFVSADESHVVKSVHKFIENQEYTTKESHPLDSEKHIIHFMYGHLSFRYFKSFPLPEKMKVVLTIHEPPELIARWKFKKSFSRADAIIVMSRYQKACVRQLTGIDKVFVVPHGIDTNYYYPLRPKVRNRVFTTISVGHYMRDIPTLVSAIRLLHSRGFVCRHNIVTFEDKFKHFEGLPNVNLFSGITDEKLREFYQTSDCLLLPLIDSTANNSVLESMACGTPPIITDVGGVREYVAKRCALFVPKGDVRAIVKYIGKYHDKPERLHKLGAHCREHVQKFTWDKVALETKKAYEAL